MEIFYGETICDTTTKNEKPYDNNTYYFYEKHYKCGVHSKESRTKLMKNPNKQMTIFEKIKEKNTMCYL